MSWFFAPDKEKILTALHEMRDPALLDGQLGAHMVESIVLQGRHVLVTLHIDASQASTLEPLRQKIEHKLASLRGVRTARVILTAEKAPDETTVQKKKAAPLLELLAPNVKHIIAVASGKGGVGKSTVAVNLAVALARAGAKAGILDADIYGPSVPIMLGLRGQKPVQEDGKIVPLRAHGLSVMSIGFLLADNAPLIWRGPMVQTALTQLLRDVAWGEKGSELDVLVVDMPPGTGDAQLTLAQKVPLSGVVIVSTPQEVALLDAAKGLNMFQKMSVPILGIVENMSVFCCPHCQHDTDLFGQGGARKCAETHDVPFLGEIPFSPALRANSDRGLPQGMDLTVNSESDMAPSIQHDGRIQIVFDTMAKSVLDALPIHRKASVN